MTLFCTQSKFTSRYLQYFVFYWCHSRILQYDTETTEKHLSDIGPLLPLPIPPPAPAAAAAAAAPPPPPPPTPPPCYM